MTSSSSSHFFVRAVIVLVVLNVASSFANDTSRDNNSLQFRFAEFKRHPRGHQESYVAPAKNIAEVTNDMSLRMRDASGKNGKFISGKHPLARVRRSSSATLTSVHDADADDVRSFSGVRRARGNVHSHVNDVVRRARAVAEQHDAKSSDPEGCMDPLDVNYNYMASIHNGTMCDVNCEEVVVDLRAESALTLKVLTFLEDDSIAERSSATSFAIAVEVSWKYLEATMAFLTEAGSQVRVESFDIGFPNGFIGGGSPQTLNDDESVWTREYKRQCFDTFVANVPWSEMVDLLWSTDAHADAVQGKIHLHTVEPIIFNNDFGSHREFPELNRTWQGVFCNSPWHFLMKSVWWETCQTRLPRKEIRTREDIVSIGQQFFTQGYDDTGVVVLNLVECV